MTELLFDAKGCQITTKLPQNLMALKIELDAKNYFERRAGFSELTFNIFTGQFGV
jgi:hypothetical protein